jgi:hypothetical protein
LSAHHEGQRNAVGGGDGGDGGAAVTMGGGDGGDRGAAAAAAAGIDIALEDVERALRLKSFDYRVLNLVLHASLGRSRLEKKAAERRRRRERGGGGGDVRVEEEEEEDEEVNELHASFLAHSELLVELADDLYDYEEDVASGAFNIYRCLVAMRGATRVGLVGYRFSLALLLCVKTRFN